MGRPLSIAVGDVFGLLTVTAIGPRVNGYRFIWCTCACGAPASLVHYTSLRDGNKRSCGCLSKKHGMHGSPEYKARLSMISRCYRTGNKAFANYGGRGIRVHRRWRLSFDAFYADMGPRPTEKHSLDRVDVDGHYEPRNCRWATAAEQARNTRRTRLTLADAEAVRVRVAAGESKQAIAESLGVPIYSVWNAVTSDTREDRAARKRSRTS